MRVRIMVLLLSLFLVAGCVDRPAPEESANGDQGGEGPSSLADEVEILVEGCTDALLMATMDTAQAQALLPAGFTAADGSAFLLGPSSTPPAESGRTVAYFDSVACSSSSFDGDPVGVGHNAILVRTPDLGPDHDLEPATYEFYVVEQYYSHEDMVALLADRGVSIVRAADIRSTYTAVASPLGSGSGTVSDADGPVYSFEYESAVPSDLDGLVRLWYVSPEGIGFMALRFDAAPGALGSVTACMAREGSFAAGLVGTSCAGGEGAAGIWDDMGYELLFHWLPGVRPT